MSDFHPLKVVCCGGSLWMTFIFVVIMLKNCGGGNKMPEEDNIFRINASQKPSQMMCMSEVFLITEIKKILLLLYTE